MGASTPPNPGTATRRFWATSSANPGRLLDYSTLGRTLSDELVAEAAAVASALEALGRSSDPEGLVPAMGEVSPSFSELAGDWHHLDGFVGDVGRAFAQFLDPAWGGDRSALVDQSVTVPDLALARFGQVGFADRAEAVAAAQADLAAIRATLDALHPSADDIEALAGRVRRGQFDPAYAVTLTEGLGPEGFLDVVDLVEDAYDSPRNAGRPDDGWGLRQLAPFSAVLSTAVDTVAGTPASARIDPANDGLPADQRLAGGWLSDFVAFGVDGDSHQAFHHSLLVSQADLPAWALMRLADAGVTAMVRGHGGPVPVASTETLRVWGPDAGSTEANVLRGLGRNGVAAEQWLSATQDDVTNAEALLTYEVGATYRSTYPDRADHLIAGFGDAASDVWASGLAAADADLFALVVDTVADEGSLHVPGMEPGLARGTAAHMGTVHQRVNDGFNPSTSNTTPEFDGTAVFLREVLRDDEAASVLSSATGSYLHDQLEGGPEGERGRVLVESGRTVGVVSQAHANAIMSGAAAEDAAAGDAGDRLDFLIGMLPFGIGEAHGALDAAGPSVGHLVFGDSARDEAGDRARRSLVETQHVLAITTSVHHYDAGAVDAHTAVDAAHGFVRKFPDDDLDADIDTIRSVFLTADGRPRDKLPPVTTMTDDQFEALQAWVHSPHATGAEQVAEHNPIHYDYSKLSTGMNEAGDRVANDE